MTSLPSSTDRTLNSAGTSAPKSLRQQPWHVVLLSVFTFGLYLFFWFYKTVRDLKTRSVNVVDDNGKEIALAEPALARYVRISPLLALVSLIAITILGLLAPLFLVALPRPVFEDLLPTVKGLMPFIPLIMLASFAVVYHDIAKLSADDTLMKKNPTFAAFSLAVAMAMLWGLFKLPGAFYLMYTLVSVPAAIAQHWLNQYWQRVEPPSAVMRNAFSAVELVILLVGSFGLTMVMLTPQFDVERQPVKPVSQMSD